MEERMQACISRSLRVAPRAVQYRDARRDAPQAEQQAQTRRGGARRWRRGRRCVAAVRASGRAGLQARQKGAAHERADAQAEERLRRAVYRGPVSRICLRVPAAVLADVRCIAALCASKRGGSLMARRKFMIKS